MPEEVQSTGVDYFTLVKLEFLPFASFLGDLNLFSEISDNIKRNFYLRRTGLN